MWEGIGRWGGRWGGGGGGGVERKEVHPHARVTNRTGNACILALITYTRQQTLAIVSMRTILNLYLDLQMDLANPQINP